MTRRIEEDFLPVLMSIEVAVLGVFAAHPELTDAQVDAAYEELARRYRAEATNFAFKPGKLDGLRAVVHDVTLQNLTVFLEQSAQQPSPEDLRQCLNRLRSSVKLWTREGGRQGYLKYLDRQTGSLDGTEIE